MTVLLPNVSDYSTKQETALAHYQNVLIAERRHQTQVSDETG